jgi:hypothetical protein
MLKRNDFQKYFLVIYEEKNCLSENSRILISISFQESTESFDELIKGAVIKINETTYAKIVKNKYIVYLIKNNKWIKTKPKLVEESEYQFPTDINAVYNSNKEFVYFFKKTKYCKRKNSSRKKV